MDNKLWEKLAPLFEKALEMPTEERTQFLQGIKGDDEEMWEELTSLLDNSERALPFLAEARNVVKPPAQVAAKLNQMDPFRLVGTKVSRYEVKNVLGKGGMGVVYKAHDVELQRNIALKFLPPAYSHDEEARKRFTREARAASGLDHPNVCTIYEIGQSDNGQVFIAMAYYKGDTLSRMVSTGPVDSHSVAEYAKQIASGLQAAHSNHIVHRDIKPSNILVTETGTVKILDFGIAKMNDQQLTKTGATLGTIGYMSPERIRGNASGPESDIWSLGVLMYQMLTGRQPFRSSTQEAIMYKILNEEPAYHEDLPPGTPDYLQAIIQRALAKEVHHRYASMSEVMNDLATPNEVTQPIQRPRKKKQAVPLLNRQVTTAAALAVLAVLLLLVVRTQVWGPRATLAAPDQEKRIALLPFTYSPEENQQASAMTTGLMHVLAGMLTRLDSEESPLWVIPVSQVTRHNVDTPEKAAEMLGANVAVEGLLQQMSGKIDITLNLMEAPNSRLINFATFQSDRTPQSSASSIQDQLLESLAELLELPYNDELKKRSGLLLPDDPDAFAFYLQGVGYLQRYDKAGYIDIAIEQFNNSLEADPQFAPSHAGLCEATWEKFRRNKDLSDKEKALASCEQARTLGADKATVLIPLASVYLRTGFPDEAEQALRRALVLEPDNAEAYRWLGRVFEERVLLDSAQVNYNRAIQLKPNNWVYYNEFAIMLAEFGFPEEALRQFEFISKLTPDNYLAHNAVGVMNVILNRLDEAKLAYEKSMALQPGAIEPHRNLGIMHFREQDWEAAINILTPAAEKEDLLSLLYLGHAYYWDNQRPQAETTWKKAVDVASLMLDADPTAHYPQVFMADALAALNNTAESLDLIEQLQEEKGQLSWVAYLSGRVYERANNRAQALLSIQSALEQNFDAYLIDRDPWLEELRNTPEYQQIIREYIN